METTECAGLADVASTVRESWSRSVPEGVVGILERREGQSYNGVIER